MSRKDIKKAMNDPDPVPLKSLIIEALDACNDIDLLDLVYKLLLIEAPAN